MMNMTVTQKTKIAAFAQELAFQAGEILLKFEKRLDKLAVQHKAAQGVVGEADLKSEQFIIKKINQTYPDHKILAEEQSFAEGMIGENEFFKSEWTWVIDPLDGTSNYLSGLNYYGVCICLAHKGLPVIGIVYRPSTGEIFKAIKGQGAFKGNLKKNSRFTKIKSFKNNKNARNTMLVTGFTSEKGKRFEDEFVRFRQIMFQVRAVRRMGSAALDMCYTAQGIFDGFWEQDLAPWDVSASALICMEAGLKVTNFDGAAFNPYDKSIITARMPFFSKFRDLIQNT